MFFGIGLASPVLGGCGGGDISASAQPTREELQVYLRQVEPLRLAVNDLLERFDPVLSAYGSNRISAGEAQHQLDMLERRFSRYVVDALAITPGNGTLRDLYQPYAETYVLEDTYLSALVAAVPDRGFGHLPMTQDQQRTTIIQWRVRVEVLARQVHLKLPPDLDSAGRGEIAQSPSGS